MHKAVGGKTPFWRAAQKFRKVKLFEKRGDALGKRTISQRRAGERIFLQSHGSLL